MLRSRLLKGSTRQRLASPLCCLTVSQQGLYSIRYVYKALLSPLNQDQFLRQTQPNIFHVFEMNEMFDPTILDVVLFGAAIDYGVKIWQVSKTYEHQACIDAS